MFWRILYYLGVFGTIVCLMKLGAKWTELVQKVRFHEVASKFFATNALDPPDWTLNSCFGAFCTISVYLGQFDRLTKLGAKWAKKFVSTKSRRNVAQRTHPIHPIASKTHVLARFEQFGCILNNLVCLRNSVPLDPKLMFWCVSYYLGAFGTVWLPYETRSKTGRTSPKFRATKSHRNFSKRTHPIHPIGP